VFRVLQGLLVNITRVALLANAYGNDKNAHVLLVDLIDDAVSLPDRSDAQISGKFTLQGLSFP